jgi:hypothetical protein
MESTTNYDDIPEVPASLHEMLKPIRIIKRGGKQKRKKDYKTSRKLSPPVSILPYFDTQVSPPSQPRQLRFADFMARNRAINKTVNLNSDIAPEINPLKIQFRKNFRSPLTPHTNVTTRSMRHKTVNPAVGLCYVQELSSHKRQVTNYG